MTIFKTENTQEVLKRREFLFTALSGTLIIRNFSVGEKLKTIPVNDSFFDKRDDTIITWLGMAGALINCPGEIIKLHIVNKLDERKKAQGSGLRAQGSGHTTQDFPDRSGDNRKTC